MTKSFNGADQLIKNWLQNKNTVDFLGVWEQLNNPGFNLVEFHLIKNEAGLNRFVMSASCCGRIQTFPYSSRFAPVL